MWHTAARSWMARMHGVFLGGKSLCDIVESSILTRAVSKCYQPSFLVLDSCSHQNHPVCPVSPSCFKLTFLQGWLAKKDRWEDCHNVLALVHAKGDRNAPFVHLELQGIRDMVEFERRNADVSYLELFKPKMINRTHIGVFTQIWSQLTGMNVMM